ncbi:type II secretion system F family protein [Streptomyces albipurpureus]|uniref:Type II secretion system F family protein n=1 Tax=Streptomyces albipurpureus TaxID=2897419 RepID=A0ABT0URU6_9ACTN|nr:type II secretion system F family protein [Streptomyces sp. CWNU-1]MCM2391169.1 type II secretion system F family protein [Streptomyces sp. CWNU-1]
MSADSLHTLGAVVCALAAAVVLSAAVSVRHRQRAIRRAERLLGRERVRPRWNAEEKAVRARIWAPPAVAAIAGWVLVEGFLGGTFGLAAAYGVRRWQRARPPALMGAEGEADHQLPLAGDLLAACVAAGAGPREAAEAVGDALRGPVGERLARAAAELRLGGEPAVAWGWLAQTPGATELARCLERADATGAPAGEAVARVAERLRADRARIAATRGHRAQVLITAPVGLCFLPAFLAVGVAPVVVGLAGGLLQGN